MSEELFRWIVAGAVVIAAVCSLGVAIGAIMMARVVSRLHKSVNDVTRRVIPLIETTHRLAEENGPKISTIADHAVEVAGHAREISGVARTQAYHFGEVGRDIADRAKAHVARADAVVDNTITQVQNAGDAVRGAFTGAINGAVHTPMREASAVMAGVKAAVSAFATGKRLNIERVPQDEEMFI